MNRRHFLTGLLTTTAAIPLQKVAPLMLQGVPILFDAEIEALWQERIAAFEQSWAMAQKRIVENIFAQGSGGGAFADLLGEPK